MRPPPTAPPRLGLTEQGAAGLAGPVVGAWDAFVELAGRADLAAPSRLPGWSGADVCVHLGSWEDHRPLAGVLASAREGRPTTLAAPDAENARLVAAHRGASDDEVLEALRRSRDTVAAFLRSDEAQAVGHVFASSAVGPLPVLALVCAGTYELAVHALDLGPCGAPAPPAELLRTGLGSLLDVTGALAARRGLTAGAAAQTPEGGWRFEARDGGWVTERLPAGQVPGPVVLGPAAALLDVSAGRVSLPPLLVSGQVSVQGVPAFLHLAPLIEDVPGIPGGAALRRAAAGLRAGGRLAAQLPRLPRLGGRAR